MSTEPTATMAPRVREHLPSIVLVTLALALRLWGITWGLPNQNQLLSYHPDEGVNLVQGVLEDGNPRPHLDLKFYNYGGLYFYLWQGVVAINRSYGVIQMAPTGSTEGDAPAAAPDSTAAMILVGRLLTAVLGALTVWLVVILGSRLYGELTGRIAGLIAAVIPVAVVHGHFATVDVPATFFVLLALLYGSRLLTGQERVARKRIPDPVIAGLFCGLAGATKYNAIVVLVAPICALLLRRRLAVGIGKAEPVQVLGGAVAGFLIGCPGVLINPSKFMEDFLFELQKSGRGMGTLFVETAPGWIHHLTISLRFSLGLPLLLFALAGLGLALWRRSRQDLFLLSFFVLYYLVIGVAQVKFMRYVIPLLPVLAIFAARLFTEPWESRPAISRAVGSLGVAALMATVPVTLALCLVMSRPDARDIAATWMKRELPSGAGVAFGTTPWYYSPPLSPGFTAPSPGARRAAANQTTRFQIRLPAANTEWDKSVLAAPSPSCVVLTDIETQDALRIKNAPTVEFLQAVELDYSPTVFENLPAIFGLTIRKPDYVPNDMLYIYPRVTLWRPK